MAKKLFLLSSLVLVLILAGSSSAELTGYANNPIPFSGAGKDKTNLVLEWRTGDFVQATACHRVYLGTTFADVNTATTASSTYKGTRDVNNYTPTGLVDGQNYFWRIDEVNSTNPSSPWKGPVWTFGTYWDVKPDTWAATDGYNRTMPGYAECGGPASGRYVGIFYFLWLGQHETDGPYNITELLAANPTNPAYGPVGDYHHWEQSELGYYLSTDSYVIRRHAQQLADAGVDVVIFDVTNGPTYYSVYMELCSIWQQMRYEGQKTPQVAFVTNSDSVNVVSILYNDFYKPGNYKDLWFYWKGKPLMLAVLTGHSQEIANFFNIRRCWAWTYGQDTWNFMDYTPQRYGWHESSGVAEETSACAAQHPTTNIGRSYQNGSEPAHDQYKLTGMENQGRYFAEQWTRVLALDPEFTYITGWNEWVAGRSLSDGTIHMCGDLVPSGGTFFVDTFNAEYSRDAEPMHGNYTDNYYYQMIDGIRRQKGVRQQDPASAVTTITIDGTFTDWDSVAPEFRDTVYDTTHRNELGWGSAGTYVNNTGRNDFKLMKVARDATYVYFYVETVGNITNYTDTNWMLLFIDSDKNHSTGWEGYDYVVNYGGVGSSTTTLKSNSGGTFTWNLVQSDIAYAKSGNKMELRIPRTSIGQGSGAGTPVSFYFHWADNMQNNNLTDFFINGDSAPNRRFNYKYTINGNDTTPPIPNPSTWATVPYATNSYTIAMTATTASDPNSVEYYFHETTGHAGGSDSSWQSSPSYTDTELNASTTYTYQVRTRDKSPNWNTGTWSTAQSATTSAADTTPPSPNPSTWATVPHAISYNTIGMIATTATDSSGVEYYFDETTGHAGGSDSGWQSSPGYTDTGLSEMTTYTYEVRTRDRSPNWNAGTWSTSQSATTGSADVTPPSPNPSTWATAPYATSSTVIAMAATTATDSWPGNVEYYFDETTGHAGGADSGWQWGSTYTNTGLSVGTVYSYQVRTRDESPNWNTGQWSITKSISTPFLANSYTVSQGSYYSGTLSNMTTDDSVYFVIKSTTSGTRYATTDFTFISIGVASPTRIDIKLNSKSSTSSTTQKVSLWNYTTSVWDQKDSITNLGTSEQTRNIAVTSGCSSYISGGNLKVRTLGSKSSTNFYLYHDVLWVTITP